MQLFPLYSVGRQHWEMMDLDTTNLGKNLHVTTIVLERGDSFSLSSFFFFFLQYFIPRPNTKRLLKRCMNLNTIFFFSYKNIFYKNIEAEIRDILRI